MTLPLTLFDAEAEDGVLARALEGDDRATRIVEHRHFGFRGNEAAFIAIQSLRTGGFAASVANVTALLRRLDVIVIDRTPVAEHLEEIVRHHEFGHELELYAERMRRAWRDRETVWALEQAASRLRCSDERTGVMGGLRRALRELGDAPRSGR